MLAIPVPTNAAALARAMSKGLMTQTDGNSAVNTTAAIMAVGGGNAGGAAAAGAAAAGMFLGIMMATEAQREQAVEYRGSAIAAIPPARPIAAATTSIRARIS
jgi:hypothetical protein